MDLIGSLIAEHIHQAVSKLTTCKLNFFIISAAKIQDKICYFFSLMRTRQSENLLLSCCAIVNLVIENSLMMVISNDYNGDIK